VADLHCYRTATSKCPYETSSTRCTASTDPRSSPRHSCSDGPRQHLGRRTPVQSRPAGASVPLEERSFRWERTYTRDEWLDQLPTHSDHRTLRHDALSTLLDHVGAVIDANGGALTIRHTTELLLAVGQ